MPAFFRSGKQMSEQIDIDADSSPEQARQLMAQGDFAGARSGAQKVLDEKPGHEDATYIVAVCCRYLKEYDAARQYLGKLLELNPAYGRAFQELGHVEQAEGNGEAAIRAYREAVSLNPSLIASWRNIATLQQPNVQQEVIRNIDYLAALPPELLSAGSMMYEGKLYKSEQLCRYYLQQHPKNVEAMRLLAALGVKNGILDDAEFLLESAVVFEPDNRLARLDYINILYRRQKYARSLEEAERLLAEDPDSPTIRIAYANQCMAVGDFDRAIALYEELTRTRDADHALHLTHGHALKTVGRVEEAVEAYRNAYRTRPEFGDAYWSLANLKTYRFTDAEIEGMRATEQSLATPLEDRIHFCFALGKSFEDGEQFDEAFEYYERGNRLRKQQLNYSAEKTTERMALQKLVCTRELFERRQGTGYDAPDPIFIVGLPRAGSTLLEQILASHSMIDGTMELQNITGIAQKLDGRRRVDDQARYPAILADITDDELAALGKKYIDETRIHRGDAPCFIDKLPNNFVHIGLIHMILPNARIIDARRHPMGCCFSGFKQLFASGQEYTYGLTEIGRYYRDYVDLMDHWDQVLPGKVLRVQYEDVVADLEGQVRRILDYLDLPFEETCLRYYETDRSIRTPSSEQVRQPVYQSGVDQWRHFEAHLGPLKDALGID